MEDEDKAALAQLVQVTLALSETVKSVNATVAGMSVTARDRFIELDALRLTVQAAFGVIGDHPELNAQFAAALERVMESDLALTLGTPVSDQDIERQREWILRLLPPRVRSAMQ